MLKQLVRIVMTRQLAPCLYMKFGCTDKADGGTALMVRWTYICTLPIAPGRLALCEIRALMAEGVQHVGDRAEECSPWSPSFEQKRRRFLRHNRHIGSVLRLGMLTANGLQVLKRHQLALMRNVTCSEQVNAPSAAWSDEHRNYFYFCTVLLLNMWACPSKKTMSHDIGIKRFWNKKDLVKNEFFNMGFGMPQPISSESFLKSFVQIDFPTKNIFLRSAAKIAFFVFHEVQLIPSL